MNSDFDWKVNTPVELTKVVSHLRSLYRYSESELSTTTMYLCFRRLHKDAGPQRDDEAVFEHYRRALERMVETASSSVRYRLYDLRTGGSTASSTFARFTQIRSILLETQVLHSFQELLAIAGKQRHLLQISTADWARAHIESFMSDHARDTAEWVRGACDRRPNTYLDAEDEIHGRPWRAPTFLMMNPLGDAPYDPKRAWERQGEVVSLACLKKFEENLHWRLQARLDKAEGEARLVEAKRFPLVSPAPKSTNLSGNQIGPSAGATSPERAPGFAHSDDYRSIRFRGESYTLSPGQAIIVGTLHKAYLAGHADVSKAKLLDAVEAETSEVRDFFRKSPLWKTLVCSGPRRGSYRIGLGPKE